MDGRPNIIYQLPKFRQVKKLPIFGANSTEQKMV
jgi:hypothetical protein